MESCFEELGFLIVGRKKTRSVNSRKGGHFKYWLDWVNFTGCRLNCMKKETKISFSWYIEFWLNSVTVQNICRSSTHGFYILHILLESIGYLAKKQKSKNNQKSVKDKKSNSTNSTDIIIAMGYHCHEADSSHPSYNSAHCQCRQKHTTNFAIKQFLITAVRWI